MLEENNIITDADMKENSHPRDLSRYRVVRQEFISNPDEIQLTFNQGRIYINDYGLRQFPEEDYVRVLIDENTKSLVIRPYKKKVRASFCWCGGVKRRKARHVKCLPLFYLIFKMMQWDINARYRITGNIEDSGEDRIIYFDLRDAICFIREPRIAGNGKGADGNRTDDRTDINDPGGSGRLSNEQNRYNMQMPQEWEKHYGMPVMDYDNRKDIKTFDNMAVFDVEFANMKPDRKIIEHNDGTQTATEPQIPAINTYGISQSETEETRIHEE